MARHNAGGHAKAAALPGEIFDAIPVQPFTRELAQLAAKVDAQARRQGVTIPFLDLDRRDRFAL
jgi:hypothetical protein